MIFFFFLGERIRFCYGNNCHLCLLEYLSHDFIFYYYYCAMRIFYIFVSISREILWFFSCYAVRFAVISPS